MYSDQSTRVRAYHGKGKGRGKGRGHHGGEDQHDHDNDDDNHVGDRREESAAERSYPVDDEAPRRRAYHGKGERRGQEGEDHHQTHHRAYHGKGRYGGKGKGKGRDDRDRYDPDYDRGESSRKKGGGTQKVELSDLLYWYILLLDRYAPTTILRRQSSPTRTYQGRQYR